MNKVATSRTPSRAAGVEGPSIDELLKNGSFHERLAAARAQREKLLAKNGEEPSQFVSGPKPWETAEYMRGEPQGARGDDPAQDRDDSADDCVVPIGPQARKTETRPEAVVATDTTTDAPLRLTDPAIAAIPATPAKARSRLLQVAGGAIFGIAIGIGVGYWFAGNSLPAPRSPLAPTAQIPTPQQPPEAQPADLARIVLPGTNAAPSAAAPPQLASAVFLPATLPAISGGGPVLPAAQVAPRLEAIAPEVRLNDVEAPATVAAPEPARSPSLGLPADETDLRFAGSPAPDLIATSSRIAALAFAGDATTARPTTPDALSYPVSLRMPDAVETPATGSDAPFARQDVPRPPSRPADPAPRASDLTLVVHAPGALSEAEIGAVMGAIKAVGFEPSPSKRVEFTISQTNVRYFYAADAGAAASIAKALGARVRDFTNYSPPPPKGTVEIWIAGTGDAPFVAAAAPAKVKKTAVPAPSPAQQLKKRLIRQLRAGTFN